MTELANIQRIAAYGLAIQSDTILLSRILRSVRGGVGQWMLPGGGVEHGEHPAETVTREFQEETGLMVTVGDLLYVGSDCRTVPLRAGTDIVNLHTVFSVYAVTVTGGEMRAEDNGAMDEPSWIPLAALAHTPLLNTTEEILDNVLRLARRAFIRRREGAAATGVSRAVRSALGGFDGALELGRGLWSDTMRV